MALGVLQVHLVWRCACRLVPRARGPAVLRAAFRRAARAEVLKPVAHTHARTHSHARMHARTHTHARTGMHAHTRTKTLATMRDAVTRARVNRCASCSKAVTGRVVRVADSLCFHKECFHCAKCGASLGAKFELCDGRPLCHQCLKPPQPVAVPLPAPSEGKPVAVPGLPNGWFAKMDSSSGRVFYVHSVTGTTQWTHPGKIRSSPVPGDGTRNRGAK